MSMTMKRTLWISGAIFLIALCFWFYQLWQGLILTNMVNSYSWGLYISGLAFFVGNAAGGLVLTSSIYLFGVKKLKPLAKLGALTAFANVTAGSFADAPALIFDTPGNPTAIGKTIRRAVINTAFGNRIVSS